MREYDGMTPKVVNRLNTIYEEILRLIAKPMLRTFCDARAMSALPPKADIFTRAVRLLALCQPTPLLRSMLANWYVR